MLRLSLGSAKRSKENAASTFPFLPFSLNTHTPSPTSLPSCLPVLLSFAAPPCCLCVGFSCLMLLFFTSLCRVFIFFCFLFFPFFCAFSFVVVVVLSRLCEFRAGFIDAFPLCLLLLFFLASRQKFFLFPLRVFLFVSFFRKKNFQVAAN